MYRYVIHYAGVHECVGMRYSAVFMSVSAWLQCYVHECVGMCYSAGVHECDGMGYSADVHECVGM